MHGRTAGKSPMTRPPYRPMRNWGGRRPPPSSSGCTRVEAQRRYAASGNESQTKKYVNIASGASTDKGLDELVARLLLRGYTVQKVPGPLLLATTGGKRQVPKLMPFTLPECLQCPSTSTRCTEHALWASRSASL